MVTLELGHSETILFTKANKIYMKKKKNHFRFGIEIWKDLG